MPKILRILNRLIVGGPVLNVSYLTKYLPPEFETLLVVGEKEAHEKDADFIAKELNLKYLTVPEMGRSLNPYKDYLAFKKLKAIISDFKPDIVHTHAAKPGALGRLAAHSLDVPAIVHTYHGHVFHSYFNSYKSKVFIAAEQYLAKKTDAIIAISEAQRDELVNEFKISHLDKFRVIPLGLDLTKFQQGQKDKRAKFRKEFNLTDDIIAIGITGRLVPVKNHQLFLEGISYLLKKSSKKIKAFVIGDGETRPILESIAKEKGIIIGTKSNYFNGQLIFTSWRSDIDVINAGLDVVTLTSLNEGTPVSLIEAQAANKPIVSTKVGGIEDIIIKGQTGLLSEPNDVSSFCEHLLTIVENDELRARLGVNSSKNVTDRFSYHRLVNDVAGLYHQLLNK